MNGAKKLKVIKKKKCDFFKKKTEKKGSGDVIWREGERREREMKKKRK